MVLECEKYDRDRMEMMHVILTEMGREMNEVTERNRREWMVLLIALGRDWETNARMIDAVKDFLETIWYARSRNYIVYTEYVFFLFFFFFLFQPLTGAVAACKELQVQS